MAEAEMTRYSVFSSASDRVIKNEHDSLLRGRNNTDSIIYDDMMKLK